MIIYLYNTLHYITLHYITLHYMALHCIALHCIALHCITYIHTYIVIYIYPTKCLNHIPHYIPIISQLVSSRQERSRQAESAERLNHERWGLNQNQALKSGTCTRKNGIEPSKPLNHQKRGLNQQQKWWEKYPGRFLGIERLWINLMCGKPGINLQSGIPSGNLT